MAIGWLTALKALPWGTILSQAPTVVDAANRLLSRAGQRRGGAEAPPELASLLARIEALEEHDRADAAVMKQLADEVAALAAASQVLALRLRLVLGLAVAAVLLSVAVLAIVIFR